MPKYMVKSIVFAMIALLCVVLYPEYTKYIKKNEMEKYKNSLISKVEIVVKYGTAYCNNQDLIMVALINNSEEDIFSHTISYRILDKSDSASVYDNTYRITKVVKSKESIHNCYDLNKSIYVNDNYSFLRNIDMENILIQTHLLDINFGSHY